MFTSEISRRRAMQYGGAAGLLLGTGNSAFAMTPKKGGTLRVGKGHGQTTDSLDPGTFENGFSVGYSFAVHNYLTEVDVDGSLIGEAAESWEASEDAKTWRFKLRNAEFHNGNKLTSADVIASMNHHRGEDSTSAAKPILAAVTDLRADGDDAVVFELESGNVDFPFALSDYHLIIGPAGEDGKLDWKSGIGLGAYKLENFEPGIRCLMSRNASYWKEGRGHFDSVELIAIVDPAARTNALVTGEVDLIDRVELKTVSLLKRRRNLKVESTDGTQHYTFVMHSNVAPYDSADARLALKYGVKRQELVDKILNGFGSVGNDHPIGRGQRFFAKELEQRAYDPDKAKFHLKKAGLESLEVTLSAADAAFAGAVDAAVLFQESASAAGIKVNVDRKPNDGYWSNVWLKEPFCACYWGGRPTEDAMFSQAYQSGVDWNDGMWSNEKFDKLLLEARSELDNGKRAEMYGEMQRLVSDDAGTIIPMFAQYVFAMSDKVAHGDLMASNWGLDGERFAERWWFA